MLQTDTFSYYEIVSASIAVVSFGVSIFLAWILVATPSKYRTNLYLSLSMFIGSGVFLLRLLVVSKSELAIYAPLFVFPAMFLIGPICFFYTRAILFKKMASAMEVLKFSIPSLLTFVTFIFLLGLFPEFRDIKSINNQSSLVGKFTAIILLAAAIYISYFSILSIRYVFLYQHELENEYSQNEKGRLVWLKAYIGINILNVSAYFGLSFLYFLGYLKIPPVTPVESIINLGMVYLILYYLIRKPEVITLQYLEEILPSIPHDLKSLKTETKYSKQSLSEEERKLILLKIKNEMSENKPYLEEGISLQELAARVEIPAHHISMTINIELTQNFFQFINSYRIQEACSLLLNPIFKNKNVLNVALDAGFQSKAAFNKAFKSATGLTPTEFRIKNQIHLS